MNIYIDFEWNDFRGNLISVALVAEDGKELYEVARCDEPTEWVRENVIPVLNKLHFSTIEEIKNSVSAFLDQYDYVRIIADWPEDIEMFCALLITGPGKRNGPDVIEFRVDRDLCFAESKTPHNALEDARAIAKYAQLNRMKVVA